MVAFRPNQVALFVVSIFWAMLGAPSASAQDATPSRTTVRVLITAASGQPAITKDQLSAFVDTLPAEVQDVLPARDEPLVFAILIDISKSGKDEESFETSVALDLFRALATGRNTAFFGDFNDQLWLSDKPASLDTVLKELKDMGSFRGATALYDSVLVAARRVNETARDTNSRRAVFVVTDGNDNASRLSLNRVIPALQREGVPLFCIGLKQKHAPERAVTALQRLSDATGGVAHLVKNRSELVPSLLSEVENQNWLTLSSLPVADGRMHSLLVKSDKRLQIAAPGAVLLRPSTDGENLLQEARQSLAGDHKDTERARKALLEIVQSAKATTTPETLAWAQIYLGYIEDRANNRQSAMDWYHRALAVEGAPPGSLKMAKFGLERPLIWIRHLDATTAPPVPSR